MREPTYKTSLDLPIKQEKFITKLIDDGQFKTKSDVMIGALNVLEFLSNNMNLIQDEKLRNQIDAELTRYQLTESFFYDILSMDDQQLKSILKMIMFGYRMKLQGFTKEQFLTDKDLNAGSMVKRLSEPEKNDDPLDHFFRFNSIENDLIKLLKVKENLEIQH